MSEFLLRVEGVNLVNVIDDTDDLSTRRGGGLMILNAAAQLPETLQKETRDRLTPVATGASIGLFSFEAADENDAEAIRAAVESHFGTGTLVDPETPTVTGHLHLKHGTFVIAGSTDFPKRQLYMLVKAWREEKPFESHKKRLDDCGAGAGAALTAIHQCVKDDAAWLHLLQMHPFIPTGSPSPPAGGAQ